DASIGSGPGECPRGARAGRLRLCCAPMEDRAATALRDRVPAARGGVTRAALLRAALALPAAASFATAPARSATIVKMNTRAIPSTGEPLPLIGCGTYIGFDQAPGSPGYAELPGVVEALFAAGGRLLDSSPMYGRAEETTGELLAASGRRADAFLATKVWTSGRKEGIRQMEES